MFSTVLIVILVLMLLGAVVHPEYSVRLVNKGLMD